MNSRRDFVINQTALRVVFGPNSRGHIDAELERLGASRVLVITTHRGKAELARLSLGENIAGVFEDSRPHVPQETAVAATLMARRLDCDALLAFGGGSAVGVAKAIALEHRAVIVAVPTTYAGSEMTSIYGITSATGKRTGRDQRVKPRVVIYDAELTASLPVALATTSGFNAMAHAVEALYAPAADPITLLMARESIAALGRALPALAAEPSDMRARAEALYGAFLSGSALNNARMGLHHKLCHVLGGDYDLPHASTHTIVLPHVIAYNRAGAPEAIAQVAGALNVDDAAAGLFELMTRVNAPTALKDLGMAEADLDGVVARALENAYENPTPLEPVRLRALLDDAYFGKPPRA